MGRVTFTSTSVYKITSGARNEPKSVISSVIFIIFIAFFLVFPCFFNIFQLISMVFPSMFHRFTPFHSFFPPPSHGLRLGHLRRLEARQFDLAEQVDVRRLHRRLARHGAVLAVVLLRQDLQAEGLGLQALLAALQVVIATDLSLRENSEISLNGREREREKKNIIYSIVAYFITSY